MSEEPRSTNGREQVARSENGGEQVAEPTPSAGVRQTSREDNGDR